MTRKAKISRRQFLTGAFRERDVALSKTRVTRPCLATSPRESSASPQLWLGGWAQSGRNFTTPETAPQIPDWDDGIDGVLEEMENLKGIEDF